MNGANQPVQPLRPLSDNGEILLKKLEGKPGSNGQPVLVGYLDDTGKPTNGWGHTGSDVTVDVRIPYEVAQHNFEQDTQWACRAVENLVRVPLNDNQFDALIIFSYNIGVEAFRDSTLLVKLNTGDYAAVPEQIKRWVHSKDKSGKITVNEGLQARRTAETSLWSTPTNIALPTAPVVIVPGTPAASVPLPGPQDHPETARTPVAPPQSVGRSPTGRKAIASVVAGAGGIALQVVQFAQPTAHAAVGVLHELMVLPHWVVASVTVGLAGGAAVLAGWVMLDIRKDV